MLVIILEREIEKMNLYISNNKTNNFTNISDIELFDISGGVNWGSVANAALTVAAVSSVFPGCQGVTVVCGCFATVYYIC